MYITSIFSFSYKSSLFSGSPTLYHTIPTFHYPWKKKAFENIVGKGENAGNQHFLLFPQCFLPCQRKILTILASLKSSSANAFNLDKSKILSFGKEFKLMILIMV